MRTSVWVLWLVAAICLVHTTGSSCSDGKKGAKGDKGVTGDTGATGATGAAGATGPAGAKGDTGATGPTGPHGSNGTNGAVGTAGTTGAAGPAGVNGINGTNGLNGINGINGTNAILTGTPNQINATRLPNGAMILGTPQNIDTACAFSASSITLQTTGGVASPISYNEVYTHVTTFSGPINRTASMNVQIVRTDSTVRMLVPSVTGTGINVGDVLRMDTPVPIRFCPSNEQYFEHALIAVNDVLTGGYFLVRSAGSDRKFYIGMNWSAAFTPNTGRTGLVSGCTYTYILD